jgi:hypothetical protein
MGGGRAGPTRPASTAEVSIEAAGLLLYLCAKSIGPPLVYLGQCRVDQLAGVKSAFLAVTDSEGERSDSLGRQRHDQVLIEYADARQLQSTVWCGFGGRGVGAVERDGAVGDLRHGVVDERRDI